MTAIHVAPAAPSSRRIGRSIAAILGALITIAILSAVADQIAMWLGVFPGWGHVSYETGPYAIATMYRAALGVFGSYLAARLAPRNGFRHAMYLGAAGVVISLGGLVAALGGSLGPVWYPAALVAITLPCAWLGGRLFERQAVRA